MTVARGFPETSRHFRSIVTRREGHVRSKRSLARALLREHLSKHAERLPKHKRRQGTETLDQPVAVHSPNLVEDNLTRLALKPAGHSERVRVATCGKRRDDESPQVSVQLIRRHHHAGPCLANLAPSGGVKVDQEHVSSTDLSYRQRHSSSSKRVLLGSSSRRSSTRSRIRRAASAQPARGSLRELITIAPSRTCTSTSSSRPASSISGLGRRTPRELPIRMSRDFIFLHHLPEVVTLYSRTTATSSGAKPDGPWKRNNFVVA